MAGTIIVDKVQLDVGQDTLRVFANTGSTIFTANTLGINAASLGYGTVPVAQIPQLTTAKMPTGSVLQVVRSDYTTLTSTTSTSTWSNVGSATITPSSASNKILITVNYHSSGIGAMRLLRGATALNTPTANYMKYSYYEALNQLNYGANSAREITTMQYYDSPSTTSSTTYNVEMIAYSLGHGGTGFGVNEVHGSVTFSGITLMEIAA
jgi:hypothetical protein